MRTDLRPSDSRTFNYIQSNVESWRNEADVLVDIAYKLEADRDPRDSRFINSRFCNEYYMLVGFALENYYKGVIIANKLRNGEHIKADELDSIISTHILAELVPDAGVIVKDRLHKSYLDYITECIKWRGRYPLPRGARGIRGSITYHPPKKGEKYQFITGVSLVIPIDAVHELIDQAKSNLDKCAIKKDKI